MMVNPNVRSRCQAKLANGSRYWQEGSILDARADLTVGHGLLEPTGVTKGTATAGFLGTGPTSPATVALLRYLRLAEVRNYVVRNVVPAIAQIFVRT